jgi:hypothetical protein
MRRADDQKFRFVREEMRRQSRGALAGRVGNNPQAMMVRR